MRYLVTGSPRSGTHYVSYLLTASGLFAGHEAIIDFDADRNLYERPSSWWGDVNALGAAYAPKPVPTVCLWRDPREVIASLANLRWLDNLDLPFVQCYAHHAPGFTEEESTLARAARFYADWQLRAAFKADMHWSLAEIRPADYNFLALGIGAPRDFDRFGEALRTIPPVMPTPHDLLQWPDIPYARSIVSMIRSYAPLRVYLPWSIPRALR